MRRRDMLRLGLEGGAALVLGAGAGPRAEEARRDYPGSPVHAAHPLEFRLDSAYRPDLSDAAAARLAAALLAFLRAEHPSGRSISFWDLAPAQMPYLGRHLELVVEHTFRGVRENLTVRPVDPVAICSLLYNESRFHPKVVSPAGATGMAQFMPDTAIRFELTPVAHLDLWVRYREARQAFRSERRRRIRSFASRHSLRGFDPDTVLRRAGERRDLSILEEYLEIVDGEDPSEALLQDYIARLEADLERHQFFWNGQADLAAIDGRVSYVAVERAVRYVAQQLADYQGMVTTALAAYNAGPDAVRVRSRESILYRFGDIPDYGETIRYVQRFLAVYSAIKYQLFESL